MTQPFGIVPYQAIPDPGLEHSLDHKERAIGALISQFRDKARFTKLIEILVRPFQELEDVFWDLYINRRIDTAVGVQLDLLGALVVEERGGLSDDDYRAVIRIKVRVLFSHGTGPNLIKICQLFLGNNLFSYQEHYPAAIEITILDAAASGRWQFLKKFLRKAKSAGVRLDVIDGTGGGGNVFHYANVAGTDTTGGYDDGAYAGII